MFTVQLNNLEFHSFHGVYAEESILGNTFIVNASITFEAKGNVTALEETIDYEKVYKKISDRMKIATPLLETLAQELAALIHGHDRRIRSITVHIEKKYPVMETFRGSMAVSYKKDY